jgi:hypothetical protein
MSKTKTTIKECLIKDHRNHWRINLPFIAPEYVASDIEQILETKRKNPDFKLELNLIPEFPIGIDEYREHEKSVQNLFKRIMERRCKVSMFTISGISHDAIFNNKAIDYDFFTNDDFITWGNFLNNIITIDSSLFYSHHLTFVGPLIPKHVSLVMEEPAFDEIYPDISGAGFEFEYLTKGTSVKEISACSVKLPIGSIIHMTLRP